MITDKLPIWIKLIDWIILTGNETHNRGIGEMQPNIDLSINMERVDRSAGFDPAPIPGGPQKSILAEFLEVLGSEAPRCLD